jgi:Zn-dependent protease with chaperone function
MTDTEFEALVARLDQQAQRNPSAYRLKVMLLAVAGYGYLVLVLTVAGGLFMGSLATLPYLKAAAAKLALVFGGFFWLVASAMWVRLDPPQGRRVTRYEAPELFGMIDSLRRSLRAPRFHDVLITEDFNAAVVQTPKLGLLGWYRNALLIGLPLMKALTREQLAAVLAHEFGHLAGGHGRLNNWVYRLRFGWMRLAAALQGRQTAGSFLFQPFFKWYAPYFSAVSFPLARANEYDADRASARLTTPAVAAAALTNVNVIASFLEARFWPDLHRKADDVPSPSFTPYAQMGGVIAAGVDPTAVRGWLDMAMARQTSITDTHPALADRLCALKESPRMALPSPGDASDTLLGNEVLQSITAAFDRRWRETIQPQWERRHQEVKTKRSELAALDARQADGATLTFDERLRRAMLTDEVGAGLDAALAQFHALHAEAPADAVVCFGLGARLLRIGDDTGVALLERAIEQDEQALLPAAALLRDHYAGRDQQDEAHRWHDRWLQRLQMLEIAQAERAVVHLTDKFESHGLTPDQVEAVRTQLRAITSVRKAYMVRKHVTQFADRPFLVFGFSTRAWWGLHNRARAAEVQQHIANTVVFPHETLIICVEGENRGFARKWRSIRGARVL